MAHAQELLDKATHGVSASQVFGEPYEKDGVTVIPVARVLGGGGGGYGSDEGVGSGYGVRAEPVGAYVITAGHVKWEPAVNVNKIVTGAMVVGALGILGAPRIIKQARKLFR
jgi:uncharacterized spore protein YtfJ